MKKFSNKEIADYYDQTVTHYRKFWDLNHSLAIHYGIWEQGIKTFRQSLQNTDRILAEKAQVKRADYILDAGCGIGGSAIYLAEKYNCRVKGITLSDRQVKWAKENAEKHNLSSLLSFENKDYCDTGYNNGSFDLIWALESVGTSASKSEFINESYRMLKPGGRLVLADYFKTGNFSTDNNKIMKRWLNNWAISDLDTVEDFEYKLIKAGFRNIVIDDYSRNIKSSARRMYLVSFPGYIATKLYNLFYNATPFSKTHYMASLNQYRALKKGYWKYKVILAYKP
ncbi:MAG: class I SAM-dependent methyltransferase [Bacteroidales bacterium]|nr:MAG: class I SAM-dependent methyltransferase [Bacteroidales bacterium]